MSSAVLCSTLKEETTGFRGECTFLSTSLPPYLPTYCPTISLSTSPPPYLPTYFPTIFLSTSLPPYLPTYFPTISLSISSYLLHSWNFILFYITEIVFSSSCCAPFRYFKYLHFNPIIVDLLYSPLYTGGSSPLLLSEA